MRFNNMNHLYFVTPDQEANLKQVNGFKLFINLISKWRILAIELH